LVRLAGEGAAPSIDLQPPSFDFGNLELGCTNEVEISIANEGTLPVVVSEVRYEDLAGAGELVVVSGPATPFELEPGDPEVVVIRYTPVDVEPDSGILTVGADDPLVGEATAQQFGIAHLGGSNLDTYFGDDVTTTFALTAVAHEETLGVALNGAPTFVGWVYVAATNAIEFDLDHIPATGDEVTVEYIVLGDCPD
jgi:hypothetical protein